MSAKSWAVSPVAVASATAGNGSLKRLAALEHRFALFHEGAATLYIVLGVEARLHQPAETRKVGLAVETRQLLDGALCRVHGERRVFADHPAVIVDIGVELCTGH